MPKSEVIDLLLIARDAMARYGFQYDFPSQVNQEINSIREDLVLRDKIKDLRSLLWSSIDNSDSMDLDQLEYCERGQNQELLVKVAVADVDSLVPKGSRTDLYASTNGNSVYTGVQTFSMLPERLSHNLTSLLPDHDRLAIVVEFAVLKNGNIRQGEVYRAKVANKAKLVYEEVGDWLEGRGPLPATVQNTPGLEAQLRLQDQAAVRLKNFRMEMGALELESLETKAVKSEGMVVGLVLPQENRAQYLIENFMIAANRTVMDRLDKASVPVIQRVVRTPKNWAGIVELAAGFKESLPLQPDSKSLSRFLLKRKMQDPLRFPDLSLTVVKLLGPGEYEMLAPGKPPVGHFGLAVSDYTHSTAPNRRYVDLIIQRLIKAVVAGKPSPYTRKELVEHAAWCTDRDKSAKKVERFMRKVEAAVLMRGRVGENFDAIVTGASEKGTYVRLITPPIEGRVTKGFEGLRVGQRVRVRLVELDPYQGHIDFIRLRR